MRPHALVQGAHAACYATIVMATFDSSLRLLESDGSLDFTSRPCAGGIAASLVSAS